MDGFHRSNTQQIVEEQMKRLSIAGLCCCGCFLLILLGLQITLCVYMGIYAFNNPDSEGWYGIVKGTKMMDSQEALRQAGAFALEDVHSNFVIWFQWGFANALTFAGYSSCIPFMAMFPPLALLMQCCSCYGGCSLLAWYITGLVWRCRTSGAFASGDLIVGDLDEDAWISQITASDSHFQYESGKFIWGFYVASWISMGVICCLCCCYTLIMASFGASIMFKQ